jgi:hypothetical protein
VSGFTLFCLGVVTAASVDVMWSLQGIARDLRAIRRQGEKP